MGLSLVPRPAPPTPHPTPSPLDVLLGLQPGDGRRTWSLTGLHFALGAVIVFMQAPAFGLFVSEFGSQRLPFAYIAIAVLVSALNLAYLRLSNRFPFVPLSFGVLGFLAAACVALWLGLLTPLRPAVIFILPVGFQLTINVTVLVLWPLAGRGFNLREAKRTFGVISGGNWTASLLVGLILGPLIALIGTQNLLLCAAASALAALLLLGPVARIAGVWKPGPTTAGSAPKQPRAAVNPVPVRTLLSGPMIRPLLLYVVLLWIIYYFVDNILWATAGQRFADAAQLGAFTGRVVTFYGILAAVMSLFLAGRILGRYGVRNALLLLPVLLTLDMALLAVVGTLQPSSALVFAFATIGKVLMIGLGFSLSSTAFTFLYQPLPPAIRGRTQALAEGVLQSLAIGLGGVLLLLFTSVLHFGAVGLAWLVIPISLVWIASILVIGRQYPRAVVAALDRRRLGEGPGLTLDRDTLALLRPRLADPAPAVVLYVLHTLEREDGNWSLTLESGLPQMLAHPLPEVREAALHAVSRLAVSKSAGGNTGVEAGASGNDGAHAQVVGIVTEHLKRESSPMVCSAGVEAIAALRGAEAGPFLERMLGGDPPTERAVLVALLRLPGGSAAAEARLAELAGSALPDDRARAAATCEATRRAADRALLAGLLADEVVSVRRAALAAAAQHPGADLWEGVIAACCEPETAAAAQAALVAAGERAVPAIGAALTAGEESEGDAERRQRIALTEACARIRGASVVPMLESQADALDVDVRGAALRGLAGCGVRAERGGQLRLDREVSLAGLLAAALAGIAAGSSAGGGAASLCTSALGRELSNVRERLLLLLSLQFDAASLLSARDTLADADDARRAYALEAVELQLPAAMRARIMPLVELPPPAELAARLRSAGMEVPDWTEASALAAVVGKPLELETPAAPGFAGLPPLTQAAAIHHAAVYCPQALTRLIQLGALSPYSLVRETAAWAACLDAQHPHGAAVMLSTIEKVLALKRAGIFGQTPDPVLVDVARLCDEVDLPAGAPVFAKGDPGDSLYVIVQGRVRVQDGARTLNDLGEGDVFGELALLDPEPRMASVSTLEDARLLRLEEAPFQELIRQQPEVALGVIRVITRYLRERAQDVVKLDAQLSALASR